MNEVDVEKLTMYAKSRLECNLLPEGILASKSASGNSTQAHQKCFVLVCITVFMIYFSEANTEKVSGLGERKMQSLVF